VTVARQAVLSDTGRKRRHNEDAFIVQPPLFAIADGMGGAQAGEVASRLAAEALRGAGDGSTAEERLVSLVQEANRRVYERQTEDEATSGMGTTVTAVLVDGDELVVGHVGDSRAYLVREGRLAQLTEDHSLVQELLSDGRLSPEEAERHPQRSVITRAVGTDPDVDVDLRRNAVEAGDVVLLCSDGLTDMVTDEAILRIVEQNRHDLDGAVRALVDAANAGGGEDNITVICFEVGDAEPSADETVALPTESLTAAADPDDEDTLSGIDAIPPVEPAPPAVDTAVVPPEQTRELQAAIARADRQERRGGGRRVLVVTVFVLLLLALAAAALWYVLL
jgi:protein phosphatase